MRQKRVCISFVNAISVGEGKLRCCFVFPRDALHSSSYGRVEEALSIQKGLTKWQSGNSVRMIINRKWSFMRVVHYSQTSDVDQKVSFSTEESMKTLNYRWPEGEYFVSRNRRAVYCPIPKVACSTLKMWWAELEGYDSAAFACFCGERRKLNAEHGRLNERFKLYQPGSDFSYEPVSEKSWFRFAFVRNPWARLVSSFVDKFSYRSSHALQFFAFQSRKQHRVSDAGTTERGKCEASTDLWQPDFSFRKFVECLAESNLDTDSIVDIDLHWLPQYRFFGMTEFDFIGRFESLLPDLMHICDRLSLPALKLKDVNLTDYDDQVNGADRFSELPIQQMGKLTVLPPWQCFYTPRLVRLVGEIYHEDIARFGYCFS